MPNRRKPSVYIETSVVSYLTARLARDVSIAADQRVTRTWWKQILPKCEGYVSEYVLAEIARGDAGAVARRIEAVHAMISLEGSAQIEQLASVYWKAISIPTRARADAYHLATASFHRLDYLVSWNCTHIASGRVRRIVQEINGERGIPVPVICTPRELMEV